MTWNKFLLTDSEFEQYEEFKKRPDYIGITEEDRINRKKAPEAYKVRPFYELLGKGVKFRVTDMIEVNKKAITSVRYEYMFCIGPNIKELKEKGSVGLARYLCDQYEVPYTREETLTTLADKLGEKFGPNVTILTARQWLESGLKNRERREIRLQLRAGETKQKVVNEGYLVAEPLSDIEAQEFLEKGILPETTVEVPKEESQREVDKLMEKMKELESRLSEMKPKEIVELAPETTPAVTKNKKK